MEDNLGHQSIQTNCEALREEYLPAHTCNYTHRYPHKQRHQDKSQVLDKQNQHSYFLLVLPVNRLLIFQALHLYQ